MDSPDLSKPVRQLVTDGKGVFFEQPYAVPMLLADEIRVRSVMTGVCRSDIDMMNSKFTLLPTYMHGHEGLGQVIAIGQNVTDCAVGDYVATRGEPAYADVYNCKPKTYVVVPEAAPEYIIEPVACAVNMVLSCKEELDERHNGKMLIIGGGFLAKVFYQTLEQMDLKFDIDVWTNTDTHWWGEQGVGVVLDSTTNRYDTVVDLKDTDQIKRVNVNPNALIILAAQKTVPHLFDFADWLWNNVTIKMPSPRAETFHDAMKYAVQLVQYGKIELDNIWTHSYSRETNWHRAFIEANSRSQGYGRGYIKWD